MKALRQTVGADTRREVDLFTVWRSPARSARQVRSLSSPMDQDGNRELYCDCRVIPDGASRLVRAAPASALRLAASPARPHRPARTRS